MKKYSYIFFLTCAMLGCEPYLDKTDPTATSFDEFYNTEEDLRRVAYSSYLDVFTTRHVTQLLFYMQDGKSDNAYSRVEGQYHQRIANGNFSSVSPDFLYYYETHLKHLGRLNTFIANVDVPYVENEEVRQRYKGILEGLRIWHYFVLTFRWANVPFHTEPADLETALVAATPKEEILEYLFTEGLAIANRLPKKEYERPDRYMFNQYSLKALIMRYALYHEKYELAASLAKEIMDSGYYALHPNYGALFQYEACCSGNKEFIMHHDGDSRRLVASYSFEDLGPHYRTGRGQSYVVPLKSLVDSYWTLQGETIGESSMHTKRAYELNPSLNRDPRYRASIFGHGDTFASDTIPINIYNEDGPMYHKAERGSPSGYWFKKFVDEADAFRDNGRMDFGLLRYAEVLLTYAEAKIMQGQVDALAKDCINQVRRRAGLDMELADVTQGRYTAYNQQQWIDLIRNERRIEFAGEGLRYDDLIRWRVAETALNQPALGHTREVNGTLESIKIEDRSFKPHNYLWPFHENSLKVNPGLKQNPGY
ncbi:RagB/SusD family nutrient uptake outer membrane protein [Flavobacteriaceae bacterium 3-367]|uniref:RagB/SusD family nutrient uptake outer membrane protein n=1 Tax=Eudoraea algarum TaxID=3417568 RepID=UPI00327C2563